ncbi:zinc finger protein [Histoplasma capsulatum var. duboisii H88]|uniref:Zinc finger protein n=1 Tax=Ajellomyces capsulatus (strain H88) TaxID=544711 RepID=A0A8A1LMR6_AJEC8|nr:zinc finger protein [Histoplasma capsulatum var. duboisii H88]
MLSSSARPSAWNSAAMMPGSSSSTIIPRMSRRVGPLRTRISKSVMRGKSGRNGRQGWQRRLKGGSMCLARRRRCQRRGQVRRLFLLLAGAAAPVVKRVKHPPGRCRL